MIAAGKKKGKFLVKVRRAFRRPLVGLCLLGETDFSVYAYTNDEKGQRVSKNDEHYGYNARGELTSATGNGNFSYQYDDIGNGITSAECGESSVYTANNLNQYTQLNRTIEQSEQSNSFSPAYDLDGNQTLVRTATGVWQVTYNGENRPVRWVRGNTVVTMDFDSMGRRTFYREAENDVEVSHSRFFYDGYLMIQQLGPDSPYVLQKEFIWDPTESVATKPLVFRQNGMDTTYLTHDGNKNVADVIRAAPYNDSVGHYEYAPFGALTSAVGSRAMDNPFRFSSEFSDDVLGLDYYNYRHYEPGTGRWLNRDKTEKFGDNLYNMVDNEAVSSFDYIGLWRTVKEEELKLGLVICNSKCKLTVYVSDEIEGMYPKDCAREHEFQHIKDLPPNAGCKLDEKGCCKEANMSPDVNDYGGKENLKQSECKAFLVTAKCCARKAGLFGDAAINKSYEEMLGFRTCVVNAKLAATGLLNETSKRFGSPCSNVEDFDELLRIFDAWFQRLRGGGGVK